MWYYSVVRSTAAQGEKSILLLFFPNSWPKLLDFAEENLKGSKSGGGNTRTEKIMVTMKMTRVLVPQRRDYLHHVRGNMRCGCQSDETGWL